MSATRSGLGVIATLTQGSALLRCAPHWAKFRRPCRAEFNEENSRTLSLFHPAPSAFFQSDDLIGFQILKEFLSTARPTHLNPIYLGGIADTEMQAKIVLRNVANAAANLVNLSMVFGHENDPGPYPIA